MRSFQQKCVYFWTLPEKMAPAHFFPDGLTPSTESAFFLLAAPQRDFCTFCVTGQEKASRKKLVGRRKSKERFPSFPGLKSFFIRSCFPPACTFLLNFLPLFLRGGGGEKKGPKRRRILLRNRQRGSELPICDAFPYFSKVPLIVLPLFLQG